MDNIAAAMQGAPAEIIARQVAHFHQVDQEMASASRRGSACRSSTFPRQPSERTHDDTDFSSSSLLGLTEKPPDGKSAGSFLG